MSVRIENVKKFSKCALRGIHCGDYLLKINGHEIFDVLDYRYYATSDEISAEISDENNRVKTVKIKNKGGDADSLGLEFSTYLMDAQQSCKNKCIFCFVDQMPKGMRESLYFKDDDSRLSFLFGNYITLTSISEREVNRIIDMHISPINISVHTMNPMLRVAMMKNPNAANSLDIIRRFAEGGIKMNTQLVVCPGINDGDELKYSLDRLASFYPQVESVAVVPVGLTKYRCGLYELKSYDENSASDVISIVDEFNESFMRFSGERLAFCSDEFYIKAQQVMPESDFYGDFRQLENGVGMCALLRSEFLDAMDNANKKHGHGRGTEQLHIATGEAAYPLILELCDMYKYAYPGTDISVHCILNDFFGHTVTVAGLLTGRDIIAQLKGKVEGGTLVLPSVMLRSAQEPVFLDDVTLPEMGTSLSVKIELTDGTGYDLFKHLSGTEE